VSAVITPATDQAAIDAAWARIHLGDTLKGDHYVLDVEFTPETGVDLTTHAKGRQLLTDVFGDELVWLDGETRKFRWDLTAPEDRSSVYVSEVMGMIMQAFDLYDDDADPKVEGADVIATIVEFSRA